MDNGVQRKIRLLLINPRLPESFWSFRWAIREILPGKRAVNPPLGLATLAALCPAHWDVRIVDENIEPVPLRPQADIVGVGGMGVQHERQAELLAHYRRSGYYVVAGGAYASLCPDAYAGTVDTLIAGEAEYIWKRFCADFERGEALPRYQETGVVALADSPIPRFDLLALERYSTVSLQFSRGCPYRCEFCDIIVMFGRRPRTKAPEQIGRELDALRRLGARNAFFVDDNLIGDKKAAKVLLRFLAAYQAQHRYPFSFGTEASVNLAQDTELLELFRAARFSWVFLGIETPDAASLQEAGKVQNLRTDLLASIQRIYSYGIDVLAGFIVGFDNDSTATFERQHRFIVESGIQAAMVGLLTALPRTPLYERLEREGRLRPAQASADNTKLHTNVTPKAMRYEEMLAGYGALYRRLTSEACIAARVRAKLRYLSAPTYVAEYGWREQVGIVTRLLVKGIVPGGWRRTRLFLSSLPWRRPRAMHQAMLDWIAGLSMKDYVARHLAIPIESGHARAERAFHAMRRALDRYVHAGVASCGLGASGSTPSHLLLSLTGTVDRRFFRRSTRHLRRWLDRSAASVTLQIHALRQADAAHLARLLRQLERHGERVRVAISAHLAHLIPAEASVLLTLLPPQTAGCSARPVN
jgi:radical SAM superfamily enzyme YgiQ (UPF0313 family)